MSNLWIIRAGRDSKNQRFALDNHCAVVGWGYLGSLRDYKSTDEVKSRIRKQEPDSSEQSIASSAGQLWRFANTDKDRDSVKRGDWVILPRKGGALNQHFAAGKVSGDYRFKERAPEGCQHQRPVKWEHERFPNDGVPHPLSNQATVSQIKDSGKIIRVLEGDDKAAAAVRDVKMAVGLAFKGKDMEELVRQILNAMGYDCVKPKSRGADGGLDVFATHPDKNGLVDPLCAQVKNTHGAMGAPDMQQLAGAMSEACERKKGFKGPFHKGLFVSYGGFGNKEKVKDLAERFPHIRRWDANDILRLAREYCDRIECVDCKKRLAECGISAARSVQ